MNIFLFIIAAAEASFAYLLLHRAGLLDSVCKIIVSSVLLAAAFCLRICVLDYQTYDYMDFLCKWVDFFRVNGGFSALSGSIGNYNIPYLYFLAAFSYSSIPDLYLIKFLSIFFDVLLAYSAEQLLGLIRAEARPRIALFFTVLFWPTVFLNGALWGQCDSIYVALALFAVFLVLDSRPYAGMLFLALSFGFKLQAVFIIPVFAVFFFQGKIQWKHLPAFPLTYVLLVMPAVIAGRPFLDTITLYFNQTGSIGGGLNYNSPSLFSIWDFKEVSDVAALSRIGIVAAFCFMAVILLLCFLRRKQLSDRSLLIAATLLSLGIPFLLPHMHDRYFYAADVLTLILAFAVPALSPCALLVEFASFLGYHAYLKMQYLFVMNCGAAANAISLVILSVFFIRELFSDRSSLPSPEAPLS